MGWEAILDIINKLLPGRKEAYVDELNRLNVEYAKALHEGRDTDAAILKKKMRVLRAKLGYSSDEI
jgi:RecA/RadA recombinase